MTRHFPALHQMREDADASEHDRGGAVRQSDQLAGLGITRTVSESFAVGPYRYTNVVDAIAQARRMRAHVQAEPT